MLTKYKVVFTYLDLFRYPSLRIITICSVFLFFTNNFVYYSPLALVDEFGFNFFLNGVFLNVAQFITFLFGMVIITHVRRKVFFYATAVVAFLSAFALIFLSQNKVCSSNFFSARMIVELIFFFILKFAGSFQMQVCAVYITELFPTQIASLALGLCAVFYSIPAIFIASLINDLNAINFPIMVFFCIMSVLFAVALTPLR